MPIKDDIMAKLLPFLPVYHMESCLFSMDVKQEHNCVSGNNGETKERKSVGGK